jgi:hypothetical protein
MNLVTNASEAIGDRDGIIRLTTRAVTVPEGDCVELAVSDTGAGMPPETQARVFDPFITDGRARFEKIADEPYEQRRFESKQRHRTEAALGGRNASECARCGTELPSDLPELPVPFLARSSPWANVLCF